jgi:hypothetical protein
MLQQSKSRFSRSGAQRRGHASWLLAGYSQFVCLCIERDTIFGRLALSTFKQTNINPDR